MPQPRESESRCRLPNLPADPPGHPPDLRWKIRVRLRKWLSKDYQRILSNANGQGNWWVFQRAKVRKHVFLEHALVARRALQLKILFEKRLITPIRRHHTSREMFTTLGRSKLAAYGKRSTNQESHEAPPIVFFEAKHRHTTHLG